MHLGSRYIILVSLNYYKNISMIRIILFDIQPIVFADYFCLKDNRK